MANGSLSLTFSGENIYTDTPIGYHTGCGGKCLGGGVWGSKERREHVWEYCPEVKLGLDMDVEKYIPGDCNSEW